MEPALSEVEGDYPQVHRALRFAKCSNGCALLVLDAECRECREWASRVYYGAVFKAKKGKFRLRRGRVIRKTAAFAIFMFLFSAAMVLAQDKTQSQPAAAKAAASASATQEQNLKEYIKLLREDVRSQKSAVMSTVMQLDPDQAAKFWPIYRDYDAELSKVNDLRVANIEEYAKNYDQMTDAKADELVHNAMAYQKQRAELLAKYYDRMKQGLGAITAARFLQVENQLLLIIDLQIASELPLAGSAANQ